MVGWWRKWRRATATRPTSSSTTPPRPWTASSPVGCEMGISRRGFLGCVAGSLTAGLPLDRPRRPVATSPRRVLLDLREQCALPESLSGYESALAGLGGGASVTRAHARAASGCALLIVPAALALPAAAVRAVLTCF